MSWRSFYLFVIFFCFIPNVLAQAPTVGNGSAIAPSAAEMERYGVNSQSEADTGYATRHYRLEHNSGIGSSFLQTTAPTTESSPAVKAISANPAARLPRITRIRNPSLEDIYKQEEVSPALESTISPATMRNSVFNSSANTMSSISSPSLESLPSFSKRPALTDTMQFNTFGSSNNLGF